MKEDELRNEYNRIMNDKLYARKLLGFSTDEALMEHEKFCFEHEFKEFSAKALAAVHKYETWNHTEKSGVPLRFADSSFYNYEPRNEEEQNAKDKIISFVERQDNDGVLILAGSKGTGKTHLGTSAVRATLGHYSNMEDIIIRLESSMNFKAEMREEEVYKDYATTSFLVIDEIGRTLKQEKENEILSYILRKRYDNMLPTILISNLDKATLLKKLGEAVVDRLYETGEYIEFKGSSFRIGKRKIA